MSVLSNPFRELRIATGYSTREFCAKYDISRTALTHIETGQPESISDYQLRCIANACTDREVDASRILYENWDCVTLSAAYERYRKESRRAAAKLVDVSPEVLGWGKGLSPFASFVAKVSGSRQGFCKLLKVPDAAVYRYSIGHAKAQSMPFAIEQALRDAGYKYLAVLVSMQANWIAEHT